MSRRKKVKKPAPLYVVAVLWLLWSMGFPLFSAAHFLLLIAASVLLFKFVKKRLWPDEYVDSAAEKAAEDARKMAEAAKIREAELRRQKDAEIREASRRAFEDGAAKAKHETEERMKREAEQKEAQRLAEEEARRQEEAYAGTEFDRPVPKRKRTGDAAIDKMLDDEEMAIAELRRLNKSILDEKLTMQIVHLEDVTMRIVDYIIEHPSKRSQARRFFGYYLPTTIKLLNAYDRMDETGISGMNIDGTKERVDAMMDTALEAFDKQLDALYAEEAMDISSEISVMESMLAQEGFTDDGLKSMLSKK